MHVYRHKLENGLLFPSDCYKVYTQNNYCNKIISRLYIFYV